MTGAGSIHQRRHRRRTMPVMVLALAALLAWSDVSQAQSLVNSSFETGDISGWTAGAPPGSSMEVVDSWMEDQYVTVFYPVDGGEFVVLQPGDPGAYASLSQAFTVSAGQALSCSSFFDAADTSNNDMADVRILSGDIPIATVFQSSVDEAGDAGFTPWMTWYYVFSTAGSYKVEARIINANNANDPSSLGLDDCVIGSPTAVTNFTATSADYRIVLTWSTTAELNQAGFDLYRASSETGTYFKVTPTAIASNSTDGSGTNYSFTDVPGNGTFYYTLQSANGYGAITKQGPVNAAARSPFRHPSHQPVPP